jgi:hypothetical protein
MMKMNTKDRRRPFNRMADKTPQAVAAQLGTDVSEKKGTVKSSARPQAANPMIIEAADKSRTPMSSPNTAIALKPWITRPT